jgi:hypothetical protein
LAHKGIRSGENEEKINKTNINQVSFCGQNKVEVESCLVDCQAGFGFGGWE